MSLYDVICLTETKIDQYDDVEVNGFKLLPSVIRQNCTSKSGGICVYVKEYICNYVHVRDPFTCSSHCVLWFTIDDKLLFQKTLFGVVYIPPDGSLYSSVDMFNEIENVINESDLQVCLLGDFNAHCSNCNEYVDIDNNILDFCNVPNIEQSLVNNLHILEECGIPVVRQSQDKHKVDKYGKKLLELCRSLELFFVNGRVGNDKDIGLTTCNNSVIDYAIVSPNLFRSIVDFNVLIFDPILSDIHKPICLHLCTNLTCVVDVDLNNSYVNDNDMDNTNDSNIVITLHGESESIVKPIWARDRAPVFTENLDDTSIDELLNKLEDIDPQNTDNVTVNNVVNDCVNIIRNAAEQANMFVKINDKNVKKM
ncbi:unnamed protein product [Mytilus edulis]|uniref:Endonuclease/exonuclease/phosphatase domain-containing protein n=1 Tax=Mytilus edulis TaxID=6550 RepID=A0A8S3UNJ7_MYTED|nr:unnamed protein product [Mytilus edulis]